MFPLLLLTRPKSLHKIKYLVQIRNYLTPTPHLKEKHITTCALVRWCEVSMAAAWLLSSSNLKINTSFLKAVCHKWNQFEKTN